MSAEERVEANEHLFEHLKSLLFDPRARFLPQCSLCWQIRELLLDAGFGSYWSDRAKYYWPARGFLDRYDKFHDDLDGDRVLLRVAEVALEVTKNARVMG